MYCLSTCALTKRFQPQYCRRLPAPLQSNGVPAPHGGRTEDLYLHCGLACAAPTAHPIPADQATTHTSSSSAQLPSSRQMADDDDDGVTLFAARPRKKQKHGSGTGSAPAAGLAAGGGPQPAAPGTGRTGAVAPTEAARASSGGRGGKAGAGPAGKSLGASRGAIENANDDAEAAERSGGQASTSAAAADPDTGTGTAAEVTFRSLGLTEWLCSVCRSLGMVQPTEVQRGCIPAILQGRDVIGLAQTGSGKTAAFALPILQHLARDPYGIFAVVLAPTRCVHLGACGPQDSMT